MGCYVTGYHGLGIFDKAVSSSFDNISEERGLTEDGKAVAPFSRISVTKSLRSSQRINLIFRSFHQTGVGRRRKWQFFPVRHFMIELPAERHVGFDDALCFVQVGSGVLHIKANRVDLVPL